MHRVFVDDSLRTWEAYATTARGGLPTPGRIVFRPVSDSMERARVVTIEGDLAQAEAAVASADEGALRGYLDAADPLR